MAKAEGDAKRPCVPLTNKRSGAGNWIGNRCMWGSSEDQRKQMGQWMQDNCPKCPVYSSHQATIDEKIAAL